MLKTYIEDFFTDWDKGALSISIYNEFSLQFELGEYLRKKSVGTSDRLTDLCFRIIYSLEHFLHFSSVLSALTV